MHALALLVFSIPALGGHGLHAWLGHAGCDHGGRQGEASCDSAGCNTTDCSTAVCDTASEPQAARGCSADHDHAHARHVHRKHRHDHRGHCHSSHARDHQTDHQAAVASARPLKTTPGQPSVGRFDAHDNCCVCGFLAQSNVVAQIVAPIGLNGAVSPLRASTPVRCELTSLRTFDSRGPPAFRLHV